MQRQDYVRQLLVKGIKLRDIELQLLREGWFYTASEARRYVQAFEQEAAMDHARTVRSAWKLARGHALLAVLGAAFAVLVFVILRPDGEGSYDDYALVAASIVVSSIFKLLQLFRARHNDLELEKLGAVDTRLPRLGSLQSTGSEAPDNLDAEFHDLRFRRANLDAQRSGMRPM